MDMVRENIIYLINASYTRAFWGIDVEDEVTNSFEKEVKGCKIKIHKEYQTPESNTDRYSASFKYNGLEYFLIGTMGEEEFNNIINNLFFHDKSVSFLSIYVYICEGKSTHRRMEVKDEKRISYVTRTILLIVGFLSVKNYCFKQ